jgi:hypothetical protein
MRCDEYVFCNIDVKTYLTILNIFFDWPLSFYFCLFTHSITIPVSNTFKTVFRSSLKRHVQKKHRQILNSLDDLTSEEPKQITKKTKKDEIPISSNLKNKLTSSSKRCRKSKVLKVEHPRRQVEIKARKKPIEVHLNLTKEPEKKMNQEGKIHPQNANLPRFTEKTPKDLVPLEVTKELDFKLPILHSEHSTRTKIKTEKHKEKCGTTKITRKSENRTTSKEPKKTIAFNIPRKNASRKISNKSATLKIVGKMNNAKISVVVNESSGVECHLCQKKFSQRGNLLTHVKRIHSEDKNLRYAEILTGFEG